jgi:hypothetical protein
VFYELYIHGPEVITCDYDAVQLENMWLSFTLTKLVCVYTSYMVYTPRMYVYVVTNFRVATLRLVLDWMIGFIDHLYVVTV